MQHLAYYLTTTCSYKLTNKALCVVTPLLKLAYYKLTTYLLQNLLTTFFFAYRIKAQLFILK